MKFPNLFRPRLPRRIGTVGVWFADLNRQIACSSGKEVVFDISHLETVNSEELSAITSAQLKLAARDRRLRLVNAKPHVAEVFELTRMDRMIKVEACHVQTQQPLSAIKLVRAAE